jgi:hypothetical protein
MVITPVDAAIEPLLVSFVHTDANGLVVVVIFTRNILNGKAAVGAPAS